MKKTTFIFFSLACFCAINLSAQMEKGTISLESNIGFSYIQSFTPKINAAYDYTSLPFGYGKALRFYPTIGYFLTKNTSLNLSFGGERLNYRLLRSSPGGSKYYWDNSNNTWFITTSASVRHYLNLKKPLLKPYFSGGITYQKEIKPCWDYQDQAVGATLGTGLYYIYKNRVTLNLNLEYIGRFQELFSLGKRNLLYVNFAVGYCWL